MNDRIIENFLSLCAIPHRSGHEERISAFLRDWAAEKGLTVYRDAVNNVIVEKPGTPGLENAPLTILQAHMDMVVVWEKDKAFDYLNDPITVIDDGETLRALGTSLGGDDGAGVAVIMDILEDPDAVHGPIRAIFTVDEENGMTGAENLDPKYAEGRYMINLDWEEFGSLCCSSAGSDMYRFRRAPEWVPVVEGKAFAVSVQGLSGGHSGAEIHKGYANAIRMLAGMLRAPRGFGIPVQLVSFEGGSAHNAIPSSASAVVIVPEGDAAAFLAVADTEGKVRRADILQNDPNAAYSVTPLEELPELAVSAEDTEAYLALLTEVHNGVNTVSKAIPGLVESSASLGLASLSEEYMECIIHQRSSEPARTAEMKAAYAEKAAAGDFTMEVLSSSPAWPLRPGSALVEICKKEFRALTGEEIRVEPVHAGLECGCFSQRNPGLDIISIGPEIRDIHTTRETLILKSVYDCDTLVRGILKDIADS